MKLVDIRDAAETSVANVARATNLLALYRAELERVLQARSDMEKR